jgi:hypothetical protein
MKYMRKWRARVSFLLASLLFSSFIITPSVLAAGYTFTDVTPTGGAHDHIWENIASSEDGKYMAAINNGGGDVWTSSDYGQTWADVTPSGAAMVVFVRAYPYEHSTLRL